MMNRIGPHTSVELPETANPSSGAAGKPARARNAAAESTRAAENSPTVLKAETAAGRLEKDPQKLAQAAKEFESLLLAQILKTARESGSGGWLGSGEGHGMSSTMELAETQLAQAMAEQGALGIGKLLASSVSPHAVRGTHPAALDAVDKTAVIAERGVLEIRHGSPEEPVAAATSETPDRPVEPKLHAIR
jgi:Rod binding domain-containing protein